MKFTYLGVLALLVWANSAAAQAPDPGKYSAPKNSSSRKPVARGHRVKMRDGVDLSVDIWQPDDDQKSPGDSDHHTVQQQHAGSDGRYTQPAVRRGCGYVMAIADCRGRYDSDGDWDPFNAQAQDRRLRPGRVARGRRAPGVPARSA